MISSSQSQESNVIVSPSQSNTGNSSNNEIAVVDEQGNTVGNILFNITPQPNDNLVSLPDNFCDTRFM